MKNYLVLLFKGAAMGAANVIPGVSGGTLALITGIFEPLIDAVKRLDGKAVKMIFSGKFKEFSAYVNLPFLIAVFTGVGLSIITLAKVFEYLFTNYPVLIWAFFFGLILASVYFVGKTINKWSVSTVISFLVGTSIAAGVTMMNPATENDAFLYLLLCGVVAMCSMILPGLSGSFVLILMGNYELIFIKAVNNLDFMVLLPVALGAGGGLIAFSHFLSWILKKYKDQTIAILTGFILGSITILWPWKHSLDKNYEQIPMDAYGKLLTGGEKIKVYDYQRFLPTDFNQVFFISIILVILGIVSIWLIERAATTKQSEKEIVM